MFYLKKLIIPFSLCVSLLFSGCLLDNSSSSKEDDTPKNPITKIDTDVKTQTILLNETIQYTLTVEPEGYDGELKIVLSNPEILEVDENQITGKQVGACHVSIRSESSSCSDSFWIRVVEELSSYNEFKKQYSTQLETAIVRVCCKTYNRNFLGIKIDEEVRVGYGTIIKKIGGHAYFVTSKNIFIENPDKEYREFYLYDYNADKYEIPAYQMHLYSEIAIASFTPEHINDYSVITCSTEYVYQGDYAINREAQKILRVKDTKYDKNFTLDGLISYAYGNPIFTQNCELMGMVISNDVLTTTILTSHEIKDVLKVMFE